MTEDLEIDTGFTEYAKTVEAPLPPVSQEQVDYYMKLTYRTVCVKEGGMYTVSHPELPGCYSVGRTIEQALAGLHDVKALWIEGRLQKGISIPEPKVTK